MPFFLLWFIKSQTGQKALLAIILVSAAGIALWAYGKHRYNSGKQEGIVQGIADLEKQKQAEWDQRDAAYKSQAEEQIRDGQALAKREADINKLRASTLTVLAEIRAKSQSSVEAANEIVANIPDDQLINAIRTISKRLGPPATGTAAAPVQRPQ